MFLIGLKKACRIKDLKLMIASGLCAIICLTSIAFLINRIEKSMYDITGALLGGDRVISSSLPFDESWEQLAQSYQLQQSDSSNFYSMLQTSQGLMLVAVKSVEANYPLKGHLVVSDTLNGVEQIAEHIPGLDKVWIDPNLSTRLNLKVGDWLTIGVAKFQVEKLLKEEPDRVGIGFIAAPRVLMRADDVAKTQVLQLGSRATYKKLLTGTNQQLQKFDQMAVQKLVAGMQYDKAEETRPSVATALQRSQDYIGLAISVNIILSAIVMTVTARKYSQDVIKEVALMRCMGATSSYILKIYGIGLLIIALIIGFLGTVGGYILHKIIVWGLEQFFPMQLPGAGFAPIFLGVGSALLLTIGFALPPLLALTKISPMQVFRKEQLSAQTATQISYIFAAVGFFLLIYWQVQNIQLTVVMLLAIAAIGGFSYCCIDILQFGFKQVAGYFPAVLRLSLLQIVRNAIQNTIQVIAVGLGICVVLIIFVIQKDLLNTWQSQLVEDTPNQFLININPDNATSIKEFFAKKQINTTEFFPIVRGRLTKINQQPIQENVINRPLNLTWHQSLPEDNQIISGRWFNEQDKFQPVLSIEQGFAERLGAKIGDSLTLQIAEKDITAQIINIRTVQWDSFRPNFFIIYPEGLLEDFPATYMASSYIPVKDASILNDIVQAYPEISIISTDAILTQIKKIINIVSWIVSYLWQFTWISALLLLLAVIISDLDRRVYEAALMRTMGATKRQIKYIVGLELLILGAIAGLLGSSMALFLAEYIATQLFSMLYSFKISVILLGILAGSIFMLMGGALGLRNVLRVSPVILLKRG